VSTVQEPMATYGGKGGEVEFFRSPDGAVELAVRLEGETLWLSQKQMAALFQTERSVITKHLRNIFASGELDKDSVCAFFAHTAADGKTYRTRFYNLDAILSVGYRVNSRRGTQFRIWATNVLRQHILEGYTVNARRLAELQRAIQVVARVADRRALRGDEAGALLRVVADYSRALNLIDDYDHARLPEPPGRGDPARPLTVDEARRWIDAMRERFGGDIFGREKDQGLESALTGVFQTIGGRDAYPTIEEKAANLLYFLVKNHPFVDGNKRIGAALFLGFLEKNGVLHRPDGTPRLSEEALVAVTLLVAESAPKDKEILTRLIVALLAGDIAVEGDSQEPTCEQPGQSIAP